MNKQTTAALEVSDRHENEYRFLKDRLDRGNISEAEFLSSLNDLRQRYNDLLLEVFKFDYSKVNDSDIGTTHEGL